MIEPVQPRIAVVVAGMHRSGTSALGRALALAGYTLPRTPNGPGAGNRLGHWGESDVLNVVLEQFLVGAGTAWDGPSFVDEEWQRTVDVAPLVEALRAEYPGTAPLLLKDPRVGRLVPLLARAFAEVGITPVHVLPLRHPLEVAASLEARNGLPTSTGVLLWLVYVLEAERATRGGPRAWTTFDALLADWRTTLAGLLARLDLPPADLSPEAAGELDAFLSEDERHERATSDDGLDDRALAVHRCLLDAVATGAEPDTAVLDRVRAELVAPLRGAAPLLAQARAELREERRLRAALHEAHDLLAHTARELEAAHNLLAHNARELEVAYHAHCEGSARREQELLAALEDARASR